MFFLITFPNVLVLSNLIQSFCKSQISLGKSFNLHGIYAAKGPKERIDSKGRQCLTTKAPSKPFDPRGLRVGPRTIVRPRTITHGDQVVGLVTSRGSKKGKQP